MKLEIIVVRATEHITSTGLRSLLLGALLAGSLGLLPSAVAERAGAAAGTLMPVASAAGAVTYEAEDAWLTGGATIAHTGSGFTGAGYVTGFEKTGATAVFAVGSPADGLYDISVRYAHGGQTALPLAVSANGIPQAPVILATGSKNVWSLATAKVSLRAGVNTLALVDETGGAGSADLDAVAVRGGSRLAARGATLPYLEYEAEDAATNGVLTGPSRVFGDLAAEASGRKAVTLRSSGQYVEFKLSQPANGVTLRYSIPDSADGKGRTAPLSLYVDGRFQQALTLTSRYTWLYGSYPFTNNPAGLGGHHFFDETHLLFHRMLPAGTRVRLQVDRGDTAPSYTIDLAEFEQVPDPYAQPAGYLSLAAFGADSSGHKNATAMLQRAVDSAAAQHKGLYVPAGTYLVTGHILLDKVTIRGAGPWYTVLRGRGVGLYGSYPPNPNQVYPSGGTRAVSTQVQVYDLAIEGETTDRVDSAQVNGFGGAIGGGSIIQNVWIEHTKVGMWFDGPFSDLLVVGCRLRDMTADGLNLHDGISNVTVEQTQVRNTGDDGLALWSDADADSFDVFRNNTVQAPFLANNIAMYGGEQNSILGNYLTDTLTQGGGINIGNRDYGSAVVPLSGTILVADNTLVRTGQIDPNWGYGVGAIWFYAQTQNMTARIVVSNDEIDDSTQEAVQFTGNLSVSNVSFDHLTIDKAGTFAFQVQSDVSASFDHVTARNLGVAGIYNCGNAFTMKLGAGNSGWSKKVCGNLQAIAAAPTPTVSGR